MRIAVVSDVHGNITAFEAVLADLRETAPDLILHGGDLVHGGSGNAEVLDRVREMGWPGVLGNTDEMLFRPEALTAFAAQSPQLQSLFAAIAAMAAVEREQLGPDRLGWLESLPMRQTHEAMALVHAAPETTWRSPGHESGDAELESVYAALGQPVVVYAHIHRSYIRQVGKMRIVNSGSVSLSFDGDPRASYLLLDDGRPSIRRVQYDVEREIQAMRASGLPHAEWIAKTLAAARPTMP